MVQSFLNYLEHEKRYSAKTLESYQFDLEQLQDFLDQTYEGLEAKEASYPILRSWLVYLHENHYQAISINRKIATLKSFYRYLLRREVLVKNPADKLKALKVQRKAPAFIEEKQMMQLLNDIPFGDNFLELRSQIILEILYGTGIRLSELMNLSWESIDFSQKQIKVLGKRKKERLIPVNDSLLRRIKHYQLKKNQHFARSLGHNKLIAGDRGGSPYPMLIYKTVRKYLGLVSTQSRKSPHVLRHSFATHLLNKGADLNAIKDLLGHSSLSATQIYTHNSLDKIKTIFKQAHPKA